MDIETSQLLVGEGRGGGGCSAPQASRQPVLPQSKINYCKFYATKKGCRAGDSCPFLHDPSRPKDASNEPKPRTRFQQVANSTLPENPSSSSKQALTQNDTLPSGPSPSLTEGRRFIPPPVNGSRVISKPIPKAQIEDPREFQIKQLKRRFSPSEKNENGGTSYAFSMPPSDPDFPFEMVGLECVLHVPTVYPKDGRPSLDVKNKEMGRGYQVNIERGFARLAESRPQSTLLGLMNSLDKQLESLLTEQKAETITIIPNHIPGKSARRAEPVKTVQESRNPQHKTASSSRPQEVYTPEQRRLSSARREAETRQLEARIGRLPLFSKSSDGIAYTVPIVPRKHEDLPVPLQAVESIRLFVPLLYPLQHCRAELLGVGREAAKNTEKGFEKKVKKSPETTLMGHVNYLAQDMHLLATQPEEEPEAGKAGFPDVASLSVDEPAPGKDVLPAKDDEDERSHIKFVPRPPEWAAQDEEDGSTDSEYSDSYDSGDEDEEDGGAALDTVPEPAAPTTAPERGISLSFPFLELYGVELLELVSLCITIKCERCKDTMDISNLRDKAHKNESCKKCAMPLSVGYRRELMHVNSVRAGFLDLEGCTVLDMLPSNFVPTCSECSTTHPAPGLVSVRGESSMAVCRECHRKMTFKIPEVKFLLVSAAARTNLAPVRKRPKDSLGITAGQPLPRNGRCTHYSKSYRWFRFSCCSKVFACDRCHDAESDHPNEHANRMICGYCSREQNYRPEDCGTCHSSLIKKAGSGFWEGGKGTRDKSRMSRKDPRKYKRRPGFVARKVKAGKT